MRFSNHIKAIIRVTFSIERTWMPTGGTDGTGSLGVRGLRAASRPHRDSNHIYCICRRKSALYNGEKS
jgi:hypothetical protein